MLIMPQIVEELLMSRDTKIFLLTQFGNLNNSLKSASLTNRISKLEDRFCRNETVSSSNK